MQTFSCAAQTINIDNHIVASFDVEPGDYAICRLTVWHEGGEATITRFNRNGLMIDSVMIPPPDETKAAGVAANAETASTKDPHDPNTDTKRGKK